MQRKVIYSRHPQTVVCELFVPTKLLLFHRDTWVIEAHTSWCLQSKARRSLSQHIPGDVIDKTLK